MKRAIVLALLLAASPAAGDEPPRPPRIDMDAMRIDGRLRGVQLLYFLERTHEELERASLQRRSFIPELVRTLREEAL